MAATRIVCRVGAARPALAYQITHPAGLLPSPWSRRQGRSSCISGLASRSARIRHGGSRACLLLFEPAQKFGPDLGRTGAGHQARASVEIGEIGCPATGFVRTVPPMRMSIGAVRHSRKFVLPQAWGFLATCPEDAKPALHPPVAIRSDARSHSKEHQGQGSTSLLRPCKNVQRLQPAAGWSRVAGHARARIVWQYRRRSIRAYHHGEIALLPLGGCGN